MEDVSSTKRFYDWVWPQRAAVLRLAHILTGNVADADDLAQETLLKAFTKVQTFQPGTDVKAWLLAILRNTRIDRLRAARLQPRVSLDAMQAEPESAADEPVFTRDPLEALDGFSDQEVIDALQNLPEEIRWTLLLVDVEEMNQNEAAEVLNVPLGTIKSRAHRGRLMLRESLLPLARDRRLVRD